jgi:hypothetical protein
MLRFFFAAVKVSKTRPAVALLVLEAIELSKRQLAVLTDNAFRVPLIKISVDILSVVLPLVLLCVLHQVLMIEDGELLLP